MNDNLPREQAPSAAILHAIQAPGEVVPRLAGPFDQHEPLVEWQARAVLAAVEMHCEAVTTAERERIYAALDRASDRTSLGYVAVTYNQASHQPELPTGAGLHSQIEDAVNARDWERAETAKIGRGESHVVAEVFEMGEDEIGPALERERTKWARLVARQKEADRA